MDEHSIPIRIFACKIFISCTKINKNVRIKYFFYLKKLLYRKIKYNTVVPNYGVAAQGNTLMCRKTLQ